MKRLPLVLVLAITLTGLLAAPALATQPAPDFRLQEQTAYIFAYGDGSWFEVKDATDPSTFVVHWVFYDDTTGEFVAPADPVPANYDIVMQVSIKLIPRGQVQTLPNKFLISLSIPEAGVNLSYEQSKAYWTGPYLWDQYWVDATGIPILGFNPNIGAQPYANRWLPPLTGDKGIATMNLTTDKKLAQGIYHVNYTESVVQPFTDLELMYDDQGDPLPTQKPTHTMPYTSDPVVFTFTVGPPV